MKEKQKQLDELKQKNQILKKELNELEEVKFLEFENRSENLRNQRNELKKKENEIYDEIRKLPHKEMSLKNEINHLSNLISKGNILLLSSSHFFLYFYIIFCRC